MRATTGTASRSACTRPSAVSRSCADSSALMAEREHRHPPRDQVADGSVAAALTQLARIRPVGAMATNVCPEILCSSSNALGAAAFPASSPSKV